MDGSHKACAIRGALWLVDNDPDTHISRDEQDARISSYLSRHAHYCFFGRIFRSENLGPMTVKRFRHAMSSAITNNNLQENNKSSVDQLWENKSPGMPPEYLAKLGYDKMRFAESDLPGAPTVTEGENVTLHSASSATGEAKRTISLKINVNPPRSLRPIDNRVSFHELSVAEQGAYHNCYSQLVVLQDIDAAKKDCEHDSYKFKDRASQRRALRPIIDQYSLQRWDRTNNVVVDSSAEYLFTMLSNFFHRHSIKIKDSTGRLKASGARVWREGSLAFSAETLERLRDGADRIVRERDIERGDASGRMALSAEADANLSGGEGTPRNAVSYNDYDSRSEESEDPPSKGSRKRKAKEASLPSRRESESSRQEQDDDFMPSTPLSELAVVTTEAKSPCFLPLDLATPTPQHLRRSASPQQQSVLASGSHDVPHTLSEDVDLRRLGLGIANLSSGIQHAVSSLFNSVSYDVALPSPFPSASSDDGLTTLFSRCWGNDWQSACHSLTKSRIFDAFNVMKALIAASLFEQVLKNGTSWQNDMFKYLDSSLPCPNDHAETLFDLASMNQERMLDAQRRTRVFIARSIQQSELSVVRDYANKQAESLVLLLDDHISTLSRLSQMYRPQNGQLDGIALVEDFRTQLARIMEEAVTMKLQLNLSRHSHKFFWPTTGMLFDPAHMESVYQSPYEQEGQLVGFTLFPGLSVQIDNQIHLVRPAATVTRVQDVRNGSASSTAGSGLSFG